MKTPIDLVKTARSEIKEIENKDLCSAIDNKALLIDVREGEEYSQGFISHAINIPRGLIEFAIFEHPKVKPLLCDNISETPIYLYCKSGGRSALAAQSLNKLGFNKVFSLKGGIMGWEAEGYQISKEENYHY
ncbi:rhodanese-like domain-containing protein [Aliikangiella sp. G2MR2-5]|uniref:rhodanese-like domain-containing protein n=1 Tax=Aliikangiella sp. G2MR2-5 TaxID=2788943 RepID=UPI0018A8D52B|nr:rhodanese-like domain-containing protein [Aliikangiella sp. G2MR2-5]